MRPHREEIMEKPLILLRDIHVALTPDGAREHDLAAIEICKKRYRRTLKNAFGDADFYVYKKSIDARDRNKIEYIYTVAAQPHESISEDKLQTLPRPFSFVRPYTPDFSAFSDAKREEERPVVVGFGPAGMFCAYALAKAGRKPVILERGSKIEERTQKVEAYWKAGILDENTNVQFGEGGAGTFSDGKLLTRISDPLCGYILRMFRAFGAPEEILYLAKPHIGTDKLRLVMKNMRKEIERLGGSFLFDTTLTGIVRQADGLVSSLRTSRGDIACSALFLCVGHSARDTFSSLMQSGILLSPKPFSVGVRVEHLQEDINRSLYGKFAGFPSLEPASYTLSAKIGSRAVYSFCMCPGGVVAASASARDEIVTNGMSYYARDGKNANSAIAVSVDPADYGATVEGAVAFQRQIECAAFMQAGGDSSAPIQLLGDFLNGTHSGEPNRILPTYTGKTKLCSLSELFPIFISESLRAGFAVFEKHIAGFSVPDAVLTAPETRTSSPVRMDRAPERHSVSSLNIYPCGEGAGYAGGITSAAVDGLKSALQYLEYQSHGIR